jgi:hypothetical protein
VEHQRLVFKSSLNPFHKERDLEVTEEYIKTIAKELLIFLG